MESNLTLREKLLAVEELNISFEDDFENTSKILNTIYKISQTEEELKTGFLSKTENSVNRKNQILETIEECSSSENYKTNKL